MATPLTDHVTPCDDPLVAEVALIVEPGIVASKNPEDVERSDLKRKTTDGVIISKIAHRDKAPNNALIAKAVERCAKKGSLSCLREMGRRKPGGIQAKQWVRKDRPSPLLYSFDLERANLCLLKAVLGIQAAAEGSCAISQG